MFACLFVCLFACGVSAAPLITVRSDAVIFRKSAGRVATSPLRGSSQDWMIAGGIFSGIALASLGDRTVRAELGPREKVLDYVSPFTKGFDLRDGIAATGHLYNHPVIVWGGGPLVYSTGLIAGSARLRRVGMEMTQAVSLAGAAGLILKTSFGRARPFQEEGPYHFVGPNTNNGFLSFPSGDTITAFALSTVLAQEIKSWPLRIGLYALATATAFQRLDADRHWFSDVLGAAVVGTGVGILTVRGMNEER
jgi:membrane-associated phospholipid phosphatase